MGELFTDALLLPALLLAGIAFAIPRLWAWVLPEGVIPLVINAVLSTFVLFLLSAALFLCLYLWQGARVEALLSSGWSANIVFFGKLGLVSAIIWAPIMVLSVAGLPRKWVKETW